MCQPHRWQMDVAEFTKKRQIGFRHDLPFAPPVLRGSGLYTLTFHPGACLARQAVGGGLRVITGIRHPKWVNRASASVRVRRSGRVSGGWTRVGADRALLFVCALSAGVRESQPRSRFYRPIIAGVVADSFLLTGMLMPHLISNLTNTHVWQRTPSRCPWQDNQRVQ